MKFLDKLFGPEFPRVLEQIVDNRRYAIGLRNGGKIGSLNEVYADLYIDRIYLEYKREQDPSEPEKTRLICHEKRDNILYLHSVLLTPTKLSFQESISKIVKIVDCEPLLRKIDVTYMLDDVRTRYLQKIEGCGE